jgi:gamma-glutamylcyclotransferase (GGCT)/AIG2-like uncharacterized protein YtfP
MKDRELRTTGREQEVRRCAGEHRAGAMTARDAERSAQPRGPEAHTLVFVYGTLLAGESNHELLVGAKLVAAGRTPAAFRLYDLGAFPALVRGGEHAVVGEVYEVDEPTLAALDRLEEHPEYYRRTRIVLDDGTPVETYLLDPAQVAGYPVIPSGSWRAR